MDYAQHQSSNAAGFAFAIFYFGSIIFLLASLWMVFTKAGKPGWASLIPIYNAIVLLEIAGKPIWWILLFIIPIVNFVIAIIVYVDLAKAFGKGIGFAIGLVLMPFIFFPILGFGSATYQGPPTS